MEFRGYKIIPSILPGVVNSGFNVINENGLVHECMPTIGDALEQIINDTKGGNKYSAGYEDAKAEALYNVRLTIRDIIDNGEDVETRLIELHNHINEMKKPMTYNGK